jgi:hypothetical protein
LHGAWCVTNGRLPREWGDRDRVMNIWEHDNMEAICHALREIRAGGHPVIVDPVITPSAPSALMSGQSLEPGQSIVSPGRHASLHYQHDGNLVVYLDGAPVWATMTDGATAGSLQMQHDGNLVLYSADAAVWATSTSGHPGAMVQLQDDGNFVVYADPQGPQAGTPLWASTQ